MSGATSAGPIVAPDAPTTSDAYSALVDPASTPKPGRQPATRSAITVTSPPLSLMPMMFGCDESAAATSVARLTPVKIVTLYRMTGTGDASATAREKVLNASPVMLRLYKDGVRTIT